VNNNLYIITPIFNPFGFESRYRLYREFSKHMEDSGAKLITIEAAFGNQPFEVTSAANPMHMQVRTNQILWHKERMINLAFQHLLHVAPDAAFVGWFDADITFLSPTWVEDTVHQLSHLSVVQPFSEAINLNSDEEYMWNCPGSLRSFIDARGYHQEPPLPVSATYKGHPGLACCCTREAFEGMGGLYDTCISGSADTVMSNAWKGDWSVYLPAPPSPGMVDSMKAWSVNANAVVRGRIGFTWGSVAHHWHGASVERGYEKRWSILSFHNFDPHTDLLTGADGMLRWKGNKPRLEDDVRLSLSGRNEDAPSVRKVHVATHPTPKPPHKPEPPHHHPPHHPPHPAPPCPPLHPHPPYPGDDGKAGDKK
jgi:hypothetical protein